MRPQNLDIVADRRAREEQHRVAPSVELRGDVARTIGGQRRRTPLEMRAPGSGLTGREQRVRAILVKELEKLSGGALSYLERKRLDQTLDHTFIDTELRKLRRRERTYEGLVSLVVPISAAILVGAVVAVFTGQPLGVLFALLLLPAQGFNALNGLKATRRKRFIYEALRELSDAEDSDVELSDSVAAADLLIDRLVAEDAAATRAAVRTRT